MKPKDKISSYNPCQKVILRIELEEKKVNQLKSLDLPNSFHNTNLYSAQE